MQLRSSRRILALTGVLLLLAFMTAGCARRGQAAAPEPTAEPTPAAIATVVMDAPTPPATMEPATSAPAGTPVPTPDLSAIDSLIKDIDNDLNADASAGPNEGSTP